MTHNKIRAIHPGEILREKRGVTPDTALRLARYFGGDAQSWLNLQTAYDIKLASPGLEPELKAIRPHAA